MNEYPVQLLIKVGTTGDFPYITDGHYVVLKGMNYNTSGMCYNAIVNDPHNVYSRVYSVAISDMYSYTKAHSSGGYVMCVLEP